jgi:hypothetical protein
VRRRWRGTSVKERPTVAQRHCGHPETQAAAPRAGQLRAPRGGRSRLTETLRVRGVAGSGDQGRSGGSGRSVLAVPSLSGPTAAPASGNELQVTSRCGCSCRGAGLVARFRPERRERADSSGDLRRLDGIPLAIELAPPGQGTLRLEQISERLGDSPELLTGGSRTATRRQRTLRGALDWSYELLSEPERVLFRGFRCSLEAGRLRRPRRWGRVAPLRSGGAAPLSRVVERSLVTTQATGDGGVRFGCLSPCGSMRRSVWRSTGKTLPDGSGTPSSSSL